MAITIASANAALDRNGLSEYELVKHIDGTIKIEHDPIGELGPLRYIDTGASRVRDLSITEVVGIALADLNARRAEMHESGCEIPVHPAIEKIADKSVNDLYPDRIELPTEYVEELSKPKSFSVTAEFPKSEHTRNEILAAAESVVGPGRVLIVDDTKPATVDIEVFSNGFVAPKVPVFLPLSGSHDYLPNDGRRHHVIEPAPLGSHQDRRSKGPHPHMPQQFGRAKRPESKPPAHGWTLSPNPSHAKNLANEANTAFIQRHLISGQGGIPANAGIFVQRSGAVLFRLGEDQGVSVKLTQLIDSKFMRDRAPSWWRCNFYNILMGKPLLIDEHPLTPERVRQNAALLEEFRRKAAKGAYCFLVIHHNGVTELRQSKDLRIAFGLINVGERVFIPSSDMARYDKELRAGSHGQPLGLSAL